MLAPGDKVLIKGSNAEATVVNISPFGYTNSPRFLVRREDCQHFVFGYKEDELILKEDKDNNI